LLEDCKKAALEFSEQNKITESHEWANLVIEDGLDGFTTDQGDRIRHNWENLSEEEKQLRRIKANPWINKTEQEQEQYRNNLRESMVGMYRSDAGKRLLEHKKRVGKSLLVDGKRLLSDEARARMRESAIRTNSIRQRKNLKEE
jgi:hypothetical protein